MYQKITTQSDELANLMLELTKLQPEVVKQMQKIS